MLLYRYLCLIYIIAQNNLTKTLKKRTSKHKALQHKLPELVRDLVAAPATGERHINYFYASYTGPRTIRRCFVLVAELTIHTCTSRFMQRPAFRAVTSRFPLKM